MSDYDPWAQDPVDIKLARPERLTPTEASRYLHDVHGVSRTVASLARDRCTGRGPLFRKVGASVVYEQRHLDAWVASISTGPLSRTSDAGS